MQQYLLRADQMESSFVENEYRAGRVSHDPPMHPTAS